MIEDWRQGGFGLYLHWPFCAAKCPYCDFNSHVSNSVDHDAWRDAYLREIDRYAALTPGRVLSSVFFGGGTPSLMPAETVHAILERIRHHWTPANDQEITLEANPGSVEATRFAGYAAAGVNRVSMGIQALNDADLRRLGRIHSVSEARAAFDIARSQFDRVSFDLIYARQDQTLADWRAELTEALSMTIDHLSLYQLTIEPGTAFGARFDAGGLRGLPTDDLAVDMYEVTQELCESAGMPAYEVSNHAAPGSESRHNMIYWRQGDYIGIGPGAHGRLTLGDTRWATEAYSNPAKWLTASQDAKTEKPWTSTPAHDRAGEYLMMGLRLSTGIDMQRYEHLAGSALPQSTIDRLEELGMVHLDGPTLAATPQGRMVLNAIITELLPD
ncbi:radical SAM family heme chaperone HemW [Roseovarius dicentrarchi]|uniref:radical SAM family heme chaperone HemW n=1 Tax=Roseovarius dicentrarchi TaxID=2250573 RepID=UPI001939E677|nr:radical SAM family heme chaperone HemW [Roseovarius dicentrarchi]